MDGSPLGGPVQNRNIGAARIRPAGDGTAHVLLADGGIAVIDAGDVSTVARYSWRCTRKGYAIATSARDTTILMHRLITGAPRGLDVDHVNHNTLDNRRANLRICRHAQNAANRRPSSGFSSRFKGVSIARKMASAGRAWKATIQVDGAKRHLGYFATELEAARAYDAAAVNQWGEFALLNFAERAS